MNCRKAQSLMLDSLYRELPFRKQKALDRHLKRCLACAEELRNHQSTISAFGRVDFEAPPAELNEILKEMAVKEIEQEALFAKKKAPVWYWKPTLATAAAVVLLVVVFVNYLLPAKAHKSVMQEAPSTQPGVIQEVDVMSKAPSSQSTAIELGDKAAPAESKLGQAKPEAEGAFALRRDAEAPPAKTGEIAAGFEEMNEQLKEKAAPAPLLSDGFMGAESASGAGEPAEPAIKKEVYSAGAPSKDRALSSNKAREEIFLRKAQSYEPQAAGGAAASLEEQETKAKDAVAKGNEFFDNKDYGRARMMYQQAIGLMPESEKAADVRFRLARSYQEAHRHQEALAEYLVIIEQAPDYPALAEVYLNAGDCYLALGKPSEAVNMYETVRDKFPDFREAALKKLAAIAPAGEAAGETPGDAASQKDINPAE